MREVVVVDLQAAAAPELAGRSQYFFRVYPSDDLEGVKAVQTAMMNHCELMGARVAILDPKLTLSQPPRVTAVEQMPGCAGARPTAFLRPRPVWIDDGQVRFEGLSPQPGDDPNSKQLLRFGAGKAEWVC